MSIYRDYTRERRMNIESYETDEVDLTLTCSLAINWHVDYLNGLLDAKPPKTIETEEALQTAIKCKQLFGDEFPLSHFLKRCVLDYPHYFLVPLLAALDAWKKVLLAKEPLIGDDIIKHLEKPKLFEYPKPITETVKTLLFVNAARVWVWGIYMNSLNGDEQHDRTAADQQGTERGKRENVIDKALIDNRSRWPKKLMILELDELYKTSPSKEKVRELFVKNHSDALEESRSGRKHIQNIKKQVW